METWSGITASVVFFGVLALIATERLHLTIAAFLGAMLLIFLHVLTLDQAIAYIGHSHATLALFFGVMVMVRAFEPTKIFEYLATQMVIMARGEGKRLLLGIVAITTPICAMLPNATTVMLLAPLLAKHSARALGAQDAWLAGEDGQVTEGASSNAWIVTQSGEIATRDLSHAILAGVTRRAILEAAGPAQMRISERSFSVAEAGAAAEAFLTGAGALVTPVTHIDGQPVGDGRPGPATRRIQRLYFEAIGARLPEWLG